MSYHNDDELIEEKSFRTSEDDDSFGDDLDEPLDPLEGAEDFPLEMEDDDPDNHYH